MMPEMIIYLLKVNIALLLFYAGYRFILQRYTFHTLNRFYLLVGLVYSALFPFIDLSNLLARNQQLKEKVNLLAPDWQGSVTYILNQAEDRADGYWQIVIIIFWSGVMLMSLRLAIQLVSLLILHIQSRPFAFGDFKFRKISKAVNPFSFWKTIYLNPECHEANELRSILEHEQVHVKQLHTFDVMLAELSTIFYWFNPGVWLMKKAIKANLEFITDEEVIRSGIDSKEYQYALLKSHVLPQNAMPVNNFHFLTIKKRIAMINKKPSNRINLSNYLLLLPSIMLLVLLSGISKAEFTAKSVVETITNLPEIASLPRILSDKPEDHKSVQSYTAVAVAKPAIKLVAKLVPKAIVDTAKTVKGVRILQGFRAIPTDTNLSTKPLYILDGKRLTSDLITIKPESIESITVLKGEGATTKYGAEGEEGVVEIISKARGTGQISSDLKPMTVVGFKLNQNTPRNINGVPFDGSKNISIAAVQKISIGDIDNQLILLNGKEISKSQLDGLKVSTIGTMAVLKGDDAKKEYGEKGKNGVILITTKKN